MAASFADEVTSLKTVRDDDIFVTQVSNAGTRFVGFETIDYSVLAPVLLQHGQSAVFTEMNGRLVITCHPVVESKTCVISVSEVEHDPHNFVPLSPTLHGGAVSIHTYSIDDGGVPSMVLGGLIAHPRVVKVFVSSSGVRVLQAHDRQIQNGLTSVLSGSLIPRTKPPCSLRRRPPTRASSHTSSVPTQTSRCGKSSLQRSRTTTPRYRRHPPSSF